MWHQFLDYCAIVRLESSKGRSAQNKTTKEKKTLSLNLNHLHRQNMNPNSSTDPFFWDCPVQA